MGTLLLPFQQLRYGLPSLNVAVPALNMIRVKDVQKVQHHQKPLNKCTIWYCMTNYHLQETNFHFSITDSSPSIPIIFTTVLCTGSDA
jgi:hypothetical protein